ncbi:MAG TPA: nuclear transport factor 2 family protein, partial [Candidatus Kryptonia bacterium]|nr:nuclear transport factor 2 family protein [Candidatus Kryptonia bacterium]
ARAATVYENTRPLSPADVAEAIVWCVSRPAWVNVEELLLMPTDQAAPAMVHRRPLLPHEQTQMTPLAARWLAAWNAHDLDRIMDLYAPDASHTSERVRTLLGRSSDTLTGRDSIREYVRRALAQRPGLRFELVSVSTGPCTVAIEYRATDLDPPQPVVELLDLNPAGLIAHARVYHAT